jgi:hypothetical protein
MRVLGKDLRQIIREHLEVLLESGDRDSNFRRWFGDSVVKNPDGSPMRLYHGTKVPFNAFRPSKFGKFGAGIYLTGSPQNASGYAMGSRNSDSDGAAVMPLYVRLVNPITLLMQDDGSLVLMTRDGVLTHAHEELQSMLSTGKEAVVTTSSDEFMHTVKSLGHDGIIVDFSRAVSAEEIKSADPDAVIEEIMQQIKYAEVVIFDPKQIKSASGNVGTWSPDEEDITLEESDAPTRRAQKFPGKI